MIPKAGLGRSPKILCDADIALFCSLATLLLQIKLILLTAVGQLNPTIPCYITGHSLGGAIATLAALEIAINIPQIREQLQLYTYGSPRIGDRNFAQAHSQLIPNSYRIVNLSDSVPLVPPIKIENYYINRIHEEFTMADRLVSDTHIRK